MLRLLKDDAGEVRAAAASGLWNIGRGDAAIFRHLATALAAEPGRVHADAAQRERNLSALLFAITNLASDETQRREAVDLLLSTLGFFETPSSVAYAIVHLKSLGPAARTAAPAVLSLLRTTDSEVLREYALETLGEIGDPTLVGEIAGHTADEDGKVVGSAMSAAHKLDAHGFPDFFRSAGLPVLRRRFAECAYEFAKALREFDGLGRELQPEAEAALRAAHEYAPEKSELEALLRAWSAPQDLGLR